LNLMKTLSATSFLLLVAACGSDAPTCGPTAQTFRVCAEGSVYECPVATQAQLDAEQARSQQCNGKPAAELAQCLAELPEGEMLDMTLVARCEDGGQVCVDTSTSSGPLTATCESS